MPEPKQPPPEPRRKREPPTEPTRTPQRRGNQQEPVQGEIEVDDGAVTGRWSPPREA